MITLYGIKNCDTVQKARRWLDDHHIDYHFHDVREDGLSQAQVALWVSELGWENLINKRSTSWKALSPAQREGMDNASAVAAVLEQPTLIKRPLLDTGQERRTGFKADDYQALFSRHTL
ncbi:ArsC family reductase [Parahaliea mediterranea]|uniref:ArsC family reductase n=1 Tax=Parahaliea mediterranea TaxID=651086 RepID=UPI0019D465D0|nr:ArsC family reductase [Parahaliea mediterranea]